MSNLALNPNVRFMGYNTAYGHRFNGTLSKVPLDKCIELPVAENLILGLAIGMSLEGYRPVVCIERMDFLWACADQLVNHLDKGKKLGWPPLNIIIRTCVGTNTPLNPGCQHQGDYYSIFKQLLKEIDVRRALTPTELKASYQNILESTGPVMVVEYRNMYEQPTLPTVPSKSAEA
jgi:pyruvate/2-oxoglutarate/acetoin dehydrogenase E1 component